LNAVRDTRTDVTGAKPESLNPFRSRIEAKLIHLLPTPSLTIPPVSCHLPSRQANREVRIPRTSRGDPLSMTRGRVRPPGSSFLRALIARANIRVSWAP